MSESTWADEFPNEMAAEREQIEKRRQVLEDIAAMDLPFSEDAQRLLDYLDSEDGGGS